MSNGKTVTITQRRLRNLAPRALQIVEEHKRLHIGLAAVAANLVPAAEVFIKEYDGAVSYRLGQRATMEVAREKLRALEREVRAISSSASYALPSFQTSDLFGTSETPETLISDGYKLINLLSQIGTLSQADAMMALIRTAIVEAAAAWDVAQRARGELQHIQAVVREQARMLNRELIVLRRTLRNVVGTHHLAYQSLRTARVRANVIDQDDGSRGRGAPRPYDRDSIAG